MSIKKAISILDDTLTYIKSYNFQSQQSYEEETESKSNEISSSKSNLKWPASRVRQQFIDFFAKKHNHTFKPSSSVVPHDDPTLLFTNAGMNQFKPIFLGNITDDDPLSKLNRACNSQKCIRAGDLDDVGKDTYHHTFFEMLGNWSFGDYFKQEAIDMAWDLLVNVYGLDSSRIYATYFEGEPSQNLEADIEARDIWLKYLPKERVITGNMCDNFWEMGETGPCGPCTEIHYDRIGNRDAAHLVNMDDPNVIEIWNLVFIQFNRNDDQSLQLLPNKHVDTGMGFERITSILQDCTSNYDTDIFMPIIEEIQKKTNCKVAYKGKVGDEDVSGLDMAYRVVADHIRTLTFAISDGASPDKQGRNYVIRRVCRRGVRYGKKLGGDIGFFKDLVDVVVNEMSDFFPEIKKRQKIIKSIIAEEELLFSRTLENGEKKFLQTVKELKKQNKKEIDGETAFKLYSTFGFPIDLTTLMAEEQGMSVNIDEYHQRMDKERIDSNVKGANSGFAALGDNERTHLLKNGIKETNDAYKYKWQDIDCKIVAIFDSNSKTFIDSVSEDDKQSGLCGVILDETAFYAESGGQVADIGYIMNSKDNVFEVCDVQNFGGFIIHIGKVTNGQINVSSKCRTKVDYDTYRKNVAPNHTMTHVLNFALRKVLKCEVNQKGSLCDADKLRFDYSTNKSLTMDEIAAVSKECNDVIAQKLRIFTDTFEYEKTLKINSLRAMFGERYPKNVRVVSIGIDPNKAIASPTDENNFNYSIELCGGTHLSNTSEAKDFVFLTDDALSAGIRRITALTGVKARRAIDEADELSVEFKEAGSIEDAAELSKICSTLSYKLDNAKIDAMVKDELRQKLKELKKKDRAFSKTLAKKRKKKVVDMVNGINMDDESGNFVIRRCDVALDKKAMKEGIKKFYKKKVNKDVSIMLISCSPNDKNKIIILAEIPKSVSKKDGKHCGKWVESVLEFIDGPKEWKGGKNANKAEVGGKTMSNVAKVIEVATKYMQ